MKEIHENKESHPIIGPPKRKDQTQESLFVQGFLKPTIWERVPDFKMLRLQLEFPNKMRKLMTKLKKNKYLKGTIAKSIQ